jgi:hypothetical protein
MLLDIRILFTSNEHSAAQSEGKKIDRSYIQSSSGVISRKYFQATEVSKTEALIITSHF